MISCTHFYVGIYVCVCFFNFVQHVVGAATNFIASAALSKSSSMPQLLALIFCYFYFFFLHFFHFFIAIFLIFVFVPNLLPLHLIPRKSSNPFGFMWLLEQCNMRRHTKICCDYIPADDCEILISAKRTTTTMNSNKNKIICISHFIRLSVGYPLNKFSVAIAHFKLETPFIFSSAVAVCLAISCYLWNSFSIS